MAQGDLPTPRGGFRRRRREKRQLEQLAHTTGRDVPAPRTATAHLKVIEEQGAVVPEDRADDANLDGDEQESGSPIDDGVQSRVGGFHVRPVPINEPIGD